MSLKINATTNPKNILFEYLSKKLNILSFIYLGFV